MSLMLQFVFVKEVKCQCCNWCQCAGLYFSSISCRQQQPFIPDNKCYRNWQVLMLMFAGRAVHQTSLVSRLFQKIFVVTLLQNCRNLWTS